VDLEECELGLACAAAPIFDGFGRVAAAVSVSGPSFRLGAEVLLSKVLPLVVAAAAHLSEGLGSFGI